MELGDKFCAQAMDAGAEVNFAGVYAITQQENGVFLVETDDGTEETKAIIFAGGAKPRPLSVEREQDLIGQGISYCALCDGAFFQGQDVAVIGGGNTAFSDALVLAETCRTVTLVHRRSGFRAEATQIKAVEDAKNIRLMVPYTVAALQGETQLTGLTLCHAETGELTELPVTGAFVALGRVPDTGLIADLADLDPSGFVNADENCRTKTPGLFVAGDCRSKSIRQLTTAVADGTVAAMAACEYLNA